jgi:hypothetical protein
MKERPILFSGPMVRALLDGRKTQTRRMVKPQPDRVELFPEGWGRNDGGAVNMFAPLRCPFGQPGDRLWVRESVAIDYFASAPWLEPEKRHGYRADWNSRAADVVPEPKWTPSIHMPRWASRITLEVTGVRVERLKDISESDAVAEGARRFDDLPSIHPYGQDPRWSMEEPTSAGQCLTTARFAFGNFWESINGPDSWDANPFVWVVEFKRVTP